MQDTPNRMAGDDASLHLDKPRILAEGRFARLLSHRGWEWVERTNTSAAVVIVAITPQRELVLVEQYRIPLGRRVIEAGRAVFWHDGTFGMVLFIRQRPSWITSGMFWPTGTFDSVKLPSTPLTALMSGEPEASDAH